MPLLRRLLRSKRFWIATLLPLALLALWLIWAGTAERRLASRLAAISSRHEPIHLNDIVGPDIPDSQNAATYYKSAVAALNSAAYPPCASDMTYPEYPPFSAQWYQLADASAAGNAQALALTRKARSFERVNWGNYFYQPIAPPIPINGALNPCRELANVLADAALDVHLHGDDAEAIERARNLLRLTKAMETGANIITRLTALGMASLVYDRIMVMAPALQINNGQPAATDPSVHFVPREAVADLIRELLDDGAQRDWQMETFQLERAVLIDNYESIARRQYVLRPMFQLQLIRELNNQDRYAEAIQQTDQPSAASMLVLAQPELEAALEQPTKNWVPVARLSRAPNTGPLWYANELRLEWINGVTRRAAAISLATRLFRVDHGRWPFSLQELVPRYLPSVPGDPTQMGSPPFGYVLQHAALPDGSDRPLISFGPSASSIAPPSEPKYAWYWAPANPWFDLSRWAPAPTTAPVGN